jgi:hypothetical protein
LLISARLWSCTVFVHGISGVGVQVIFQRLPLPPPEK